MSPSTSTGSRITAVFAGLALAAGVQAPVVFAQEEAPPSPPQQQAPAQDISISDAEMDQFVAAYVEVEQIQIELNEEIQSAEQPEAAQQMQQEANQKMAAVIEEKGLDVERFSLIVQAINSDPQLQEEYVAKRMEMTD